jgi:uncharacterized protein
VKYEYDPYKDKINFKKHGVPLTEVENFDWETAVVREDTRRNYPEPRFEVRGYIGDRLFVIILCLRGSVIRVISLRKANTREVKRYAKT